MKGRSPVNRVRTVSGMTRLTGDVTTNPGGGSQEAVIPANTVTSAQQTVAGRTELLGITVDGAGAVLTPGVKGFLLVAYPCTIQSVTVLSTDAGPTAGSIVFDIWKAPYASYPPTVADSITAAAKPTLSSATKSQDAALTGWTRVIEAGEVLGYAIDSVALLTRVTLIVSVTKL
jgi:hypothetical protein